MDFWIGFLLGGYLVPAAFYAANVWQADRRSEDRPSILESLATAIFNGAIWPFGRHETVVETTYEPRP